MRLRIPAFGLMSGISSSIGLLPHVLVLSFLYISGHPHRSLISLVIFTIGAKILGEYLFWKHSKARLQEDSRFIHERSLLESTTAKIALLLICVDSLLDITLIYEALKSNLNPVAVFLALLGSQMIGAPIQGLLSDAFSLKKSVLCSLLVGLLLCLSLPGGLLRVDALSSIIFDVFNLSIDASSKLLIILIVKGLLGNTGVLARSRIVNIIKNDILKL